MLVGSKGISVFVMLQGAGKYLLPLAVLVFCIDVSFLVLRYGKKNWTGTTSSHRL